MMNNYNNIKALEVNKMLFSDKNYINNLILKFIEKIIYFN